MYNKITIIGNLGADAEIVSFESGSRKMTLRVATSSGYKDKTSGEFKEETTWHTVEVWNPTDYTRTNSIKGCTVLVEGEQRHETYQANDGTTKYKSFIASRLIRILKPASVGGSSGHQNNPAMEGGFNDQAGNEDLPF